MSGDWIVSEVSRDDTYWFEEVCGVEMIASEIAISFISIFRCMYPSVSLSSLLYRCVSTQSDCYHVLSGLRML